MSGSVQTLGKGGLALGRKHTGLALLSPSCVGRTNKSDIPRPLQRHAQFFRIEQTNASCTLQKTCHHQNTIWEMCVVCVCVCVSVCLCARANVPAFSADVLNCVVEMCCPEVAPNCPKQTTDKKPNKFLDRFISAWFLTPGKQWNCRQWANVCPVSCIAPG